MADLRLDMEIAIDVLRQRLENAGISTTDWGKGTAKTLLHLVKEMEDGETFLEKSAAGQLLRYVVVAAADIYYDSPSGECYRLKEDRQIFKDGRERKRNLGRAVSEKIKLAEIPAEAVIRGIQEELGIAGAINWVEEGTTEETIDSPSYPGLTSRYVSHQFRVQLNDEQFKPEGYMESQANMTTYFLWEKL